MLPEMERAGLGWAPFQVPRWTNASLGGKHGIGVSLDVYTASDLEQKRAALKKLEAAVLRQAQPERRSP
jgi:hypothetical protein